MATVITNPNGSTIERGPGGDAIMPNPNPMFSPTPAPSVTKVQPSPKPSASPAAPVAALTGANSAQLEALRQQLLKIKEGADALAAQQKTSDSAVVASSSKTRKEENDTKNKVKEFNEANERAKLEAASSTQYIDDYMMALEARRKAEVDSINQGFGVAKEQLETKQKNETGSTTATLARIGGYLGGSASGTGAMINLGITHKNEVLALEAKRQAAINEANNAISDKQFQLARMKVEEAKDIEKELETRKQRFFENNMAILQEDRLQNKALSEKFKDQLENFSLMDPTAIPKDKMAEIDDFYGVPGFTQRYVEVTAAAAKAKSEKEVLATRQSLLNLLQDIPQGQTVKFPDGTEYTGIGSTDDISTSLQVDSNGIGRMIAYNKGTGKFTITPVGAVGKKSGTGTTAGSVDPVERDNVRSMLTMRLEESKLKDGTYDPDTYMNERKLIKEAYPQLVEYVDKLYLNPQYDFFNDESIVRLRKKGIYVGDQPLLGVDEESTDENE